MIGVEAHPEGTLVDRALAALTARPRDAGELAREVLGLPNVPGPVAERLAAALLGADPRVRRLGDGRWSLVPAAREGGPLLEDCAFAVVDLETTGGRPARGDRITELAVYLVQGVRCEPVLDTLVNPLRPIPPAVAAVTRITEAMVRAAPAFADIAGAVLGALAGRVFVAHNVRFDWRFLALELRRARALRLDGPRLCTVRLARRLVPNVESCSLDGLTLRFGYENPARHRAGGDALVTARLLQRLLRLAREAGARTLADLVALQKTGRRYDGRTTGEVTGGGPEVVPSDPTVLPSTV